MPLSSTVTLVPVGMGIPFRRQVIVIGPSPSISQSNIKGRSRTAITSLGSLIKASSEAPLKPGREKRGKKVR